ncbi:MAG: riboflavin biosynthesis protein RibF [Bacteroidota bacterium]|nr:riboflavin biosynthesis protein RibF [Candidatus Kapabacteria bacterium]MDW8219474.1 riboflavin biosynthesis protein RibF [Bacteroidota bacterium]
MLVYHSFDEVPYNQATVLTIGTFDGLHKGHIALINLMKERAKKLNAKTLLITFHPHPQIVLQKPDRPPVELLTTIKERIELLSQLGIDAVLVVHFTKEFSQIHAEQFVREYLVGKLNMKHIVIGYDHAFGKDRQGSEDLLTTLSGELRFSVEKAPIVDLDGEVISSTKVRRAIAAGDIARANQLLGFPYLVGGKVVAGDGRGRKLGLPTANIEPSEPQKLLPKNGVYLVSSLIDGRNVFGMANIGIRPTFTDDIHPRLEVHFFDWNTMLYDRELMIAFLKFIRSERKFESTGLFFEQIVADRDACMEAIENIKQGKPF